MQIAKNVPHSSEFDRMVLNALSKLAESLEYAVMRYIAPFALTCPVTSSPRPPHRWDRTVKTRLFSPSASQSARPTAAVCLPPRREQDRLGFIAEKSPALEITEKFGLLFPTFLFCFLLFVFSCLTSGFEK